MVAVEDKEEDEVCSRSRGPFECTRTEADKVLTRSKQTYLPYLSTRKVEHRHRVFATAS